MERWQQARIRKNLYGLIMKTNCDSSFLGVFESGNGLGPGDVAQIKTIAEGAGAEMMAAVFYWHLLKSPQSNAYDLLLSVLRAMRQTDALKLLSARPGPASLCGSNFLSEERVESDEKSRITRNLHMLIACTKCDLAFLAVFQLGQVLQLRDVALIDSIPGQDPEFKAMLFYLRLLMSPNKAGYSLLVNVFQLSGQFEALQLLCNQGVAQPAYAISPRDLESERDRRGSIVSTISASSSATIPIVRSKRARVEDTPAEAGRRSFDRVVAGGRRCNRLSKDGRRTKCRVVTTAQTPSGVRQERKRPN